MKVYINCRSQKTLHPDILKSIQSQSIKPEIEFIESNKCPTRLSLLAECNSEVAIFMDEDVVLPRSQFLEDIDFLMKNNSNIQFLTGSYISNPEASYLQKAYNWITNLWTLPSEDEISECQNAAGGFWAIKKDISSVCSDWMEPKTWGGEDTRAVRFIQSKGIQIYTSSKLSVLHYPRSNLSWFLFRAFQQGRAKYRWKLESNIKPLSIIKKVRNNAFYIPALLIHQLAVGLGFNFERILSCAAYIKPTTPETK